MIKNIILLIIIGFTFSYCAQNIDTKDNIENAFHEDEENKKLLVDNLVPNELVARKIAETILISVYGDSILEQKPFDVKLIDNSYWVIKGTKKRPYPGGVAYIEISKKDCRVLKIIHGN